MVAYSDPRWIQGAFNTLVVLFYRVVLQTNVGKRVGMVCHPCQAARNKSEAAYRKRIAGEGPIYRERQKGQVHCRECGEEMEAGSMARHMMNQHGRAAEARRSCKTLVTGKEPRTYRMAFLANVGLHSYLVEGFPGQAGTKMAMQIHFLYRHVLDTVVIMEKGNLPYPWCT